MNEERRWNGEEHRKARSEGDQIERLMREAFLKLFADGCLVYRDRELRGGSVQTKSDRLRRLRNAEELALEGGAAVLGMSMARMLERLERRAAGEVLAETEMRELRARARTYARRLARLREAHPEVEVELSPEIEELLAEPAISA